MILGSGRYPQSGSVIDIAEREGRRRGEITLGWDSVPPAYSYLVYISQQPDMSGTVISIEIPDRGIVNGVIEMTLTLEPGAYYWFFEALAFGRGKFMESPIWSFRGYDTQNPPPPPPPPKVRWNIENVPPPDSQPPSGSTPAKNDSAATYLMWGSAALVALALFGTFKTSKR
jgi:hypothetical protein